MNQHALAEHRKRGWAGRAAVLEEKSRVEALRQRGGQKCIGLWGSMAAMDGH